jgi:hypothetical protein
MVLWQELRAWQPHVVARQHGREVSLSRWTKVECVGVVGLDHHTM